MKKNMYFRSQFQRKSKLLNSIMELFLALSSYPRLILEVFLRRNMGERYFSLGAAITIGILLALYPVAGDMVSNMLPRGFRSEVGMYHKYSGFISHYCSWYLFLLPFGYFSVLRWAEVKRNPSVFDFARFSLTSGDVRPLFLGMKIFGSPASQRQIEIILEPVAAFLVGMTLYMMGQAVGGLVIFCSIIYSLSYIAAYKKGDDFVMDRIDEMIMSEEMENAFVHGKDSSRSRGVRFFTRKPQREELRQQLAGAFVIEDRHEIADVI